MSRFVHYLFAGALAGLALHPRAGAAQEPAGPVRVLFVGNSFLHGKYPPVLGYNATGVTDENYGLAKNSPRFENHPEEPGPWGGIPGIFQKMTQEAGLRYEVHLELISGKTLKYHYANALRIVQQPGWQAVVMHDNSAWPLPAARTGHPDEFREYAPKLAEAIHQGSPQARVYLYETWVRADLTYPAGKPYAGLPPDSMQADLHRAYYGAAAQDKALAGVVPAGDAWLRAIASGVADANPYDGLDAGKVDLWGPDHYHPSPYGAYLNACVLLGEVAGADPRTLGAREQAAAALGIAPATAVALQRVAAEQVLAARPGAFGQAGAGKAGKVKVKRKA